MTDVQMPEDRLAWIDTETTGLLHERPLLLEFAIVVTDASPKLQVLGEFSRVVFQHRPAAVSRMKPEVLEMHMRSGLIAELAVADQRTSDVFVVELAAIEFLAELGALGAPAAGSNVGGFDRQILDEFMPELNRNALHYRSPDVSTVKELARRWAPGVLATAPKKAKGHRALADVHESIEEMRHYVAAGFIRPEVVPGSAGGCSGHCPVQHRDGMPPWCQACGLTATGDVPMSRIPGAGR